MSIALLCLAGVLLKRNIQVEVGGRTLGWSIVGILLVLAAGVTFPMGTNLPAWQVIPLPTDQNNRISSMTSDGNEVLVLFSSGPERGSSRERKYGLVRAHIGERASVVDDPIWFADPGQTPDFYYNASNLLRPAETRSLAYVILTQTVRQNRPITERTRTLCTIALDAGQNDPIVHRVPLNPLLGAGDVWPTACVDRQRLYVYCTQHSKAQLLTFSLADPRAPSLIDSKDLPERTGMPSRASSEQYQIGLIPVLDVNNPTRLEITHKLVPELWTPAGDDRVLASVFNRDGLGMQLELFETQQAQDNVMSLHSVSHRRTPTIERFFGLSFGSLYYSAPFVYQLSGTGVTVYDITSSNQIKRIGHYAAGGGFSEIVSLPGNRVVLAGDRLHILDLSEKVRSLTR